MILTGVRHSAQLELGMDKNGEVRVYYHASLSELLKWYRDTADPTQSINKNARSFTVTLEFDGCLPATLPELTSDTEARVAVTVGGPRAATLTENTLTVIKRAQKEAR